MSYILDALKRADAERERGHVPGLHSQSADAPAALPRQASRFTSPKTVVSLVGLCLLLGAAGGLWWFSRAPVLPTRSVPAPVAPTQAPAVAAPATAETAPTATAAVAPLSPPAQPVDTPPEPAAPILMPPPPLPALETRAAPTPPPASSATARASGAAPALPASNSSPVANGNRDAPVPRFADLPPELRAQLPQLNVSGSSYSSDPAHRLLIVNGKVAHEGQEIAPGLLLEQIGLHQSVLSHRGSRFSITH